MVEKNDDVQSGKDEEEQSDDKKDTALAPPSGLPFHEHEVHAHPEGHEINSSLSRVSYIWYQLRGQALTVENALEEESHELGDIDWECVRHARGGRATRVEVSPR